MATQSISETMLCEFINEFSSTFNTELIELIKEYVQHNECGLAYDALVFYLKAQIHVDETIISKVRQIGASMEIIYPSLSTD